MVAVIGKVPVLVAVNEGTFPFPPAANPMSVLLLVHVNVVPVVGLVNAVAGTVAPLQTTMFAGTTTDTVGFTVIVYVEGVPGQVFIEGVTVIVAEMVVVPVFVAVKDGTSPVPLEPNPIAVLLLVHAKIAPGVGLLNAVAGMVTPLQTAKFAGTTTVVVGYTVIV